MDSFPAINLIYNFLKMDIDNLINWGELSRLLAGSRMTIRKNKIPKKHEKKIQDLKDALEKWKEQAL